jgi:hypothetical protein
LTSSTRVVVRFVALLRYTFRTAICVPPVAACRWDGFRP